MAEVGLSISDMFVLLNDVLSATESGKVKDWENGTPTCPSNKKPLTIAGKV